VVITAKKFNDIDSCRLAFLLPNVSLVEDEADELPLEAGTTTPRSSSKVLGLVSIRPVVNVAKLFSFVADGSA
jgi:hypothetical protein